MTTFMEESEDMFNMKKNIKRIKGFVKSILKKLKIKIKLTKENLDIKIGHYKKVELSVADILYNNSKSNELLRLDIVVRYLAIENYFGKNNYGFDMYSKMQNARVKDGYSERAVVQFRELIKSYDNNGYDKNSYIIMDKALNLIDGSHRMALALYYRIPLITAYIVNSNHPVDYGLDWFFTNGFSSEEIDIILNKSKEIMGIFDSNFSCVIWGPAVEYHKEILSDLEKFARVISWKKREYTRDEYNNIVRAIYAIDDMEKWKIDKKIEYMNMYSPELVSVEIGFNDPEFRIKSATGLPLSKIGEKTKKAIRGKYSKKIENYFFDIIMHIGDNLYQSEYMKRVFDPIVSFSDFIPILNKYKYVLAKTETPYMPQNFPSEIPVGKDVDILCLEEDIETIRDEILVHCREKYSYDIEERRNNHGVQIRLNCCKKLIFLFDLAYRVDGLKDGYVSAAIKSKISKDDYYVLCPEFELVYRINAYLCNKKKRYHLDYIKENKKYINEAILTQYCAIREKDYNLIMEDLK